MPTMASRETFGGSRSIATKLRGSGTSGWNVEREAGCSYGLTSERSSPVIRCQWPGSSTVTPAGTNLSREEPDAGIPLVRVCGGQGGNLLAYPAPNIEGTASCYDRLPSCFALYVSQCLPARRNVVAISTLPCPPWRAKPRRPASHARWPIACLRVSHRTARCVPSTAASAAHSARASRNTPRPGSHQTR